MSEGQAKQPAVCIYCGRQKTRPDFVWFYYPKLGPVCPTCFGRSDEPQQRNGAAAGDSDEAPLAPRTAFDCSAWMAEVKAALAHAEKREIECRLAGDVVWPMIWRMLGRWAQRIIAKRRPSAIDPSSAAATEHPKL